MNIKDLFNKDFPMTFCDTLKQEVSEALRIHIEYDKAVMRWIDWYNMKSTPILCKDYHKTRIDGDLLFKNASILLTAYNYHIDQIKKLIHYKDIVRVDVNGLTYDVGYETGPLGNYISIKEVKDVKTN